MKNSIFIYAISNQKTDKIYVGCTRQAFKKRLSAHKNAMEKNKRANRIMQDDFNEHGWESFSCEILETINLNSKIDYFKKEQEWIDFFSRYRSVYNLTKGGKGTVGYNHTIEARKKIKKAQIGKTNSAETRKKISEAQLGEKNHMWGKKGYWKGKKQSETHRLNMIAAKKALKLPAPNRRGVVCLTTGESFFSATHAAKHFGTRQSQISRVCRGERSFWHGYKFAYVDEKCQK